MLSRLRAKAKQMASNPSPPHYYTSHHGTKQSIPSSNVSEVHSVATSYVYWEPPSLIIHHVFYMCLCDCLFALWCILTWLPQLSNHVFLFDSPSYLCTISAIWVTVCNLGGTLWYLVIAFVLFCTIFDLNYCCSNIEDKKVQCFHSLFVWSLTAIIPIIIYVLDGYGQFTNIDDKECGTKGTYQIIIYVVFMFTGIFALFLLFAILYKTYLKVCIKRLCAYTAASRSDRVIDLDSMLTAESDDAVLRGISIQRKELVSRLTEFTIVYVIVWIVPIMDRMYEWIEGNKSPKWMNVGHNWMLVSIGLGNAWVWYRSKSFVPIHKSTKSLALMQKRTEDREQLSSFIKSMASPDTVTLKYGKTVTK